MFLYGIKYNYTDKVNLNPKVNLSYIGSHKRGFANLFQYLLSFFKIFQEARKHKFKWIIAYDASTVAPVYITSKLLGIKWVYHQHDFWEKPKGLFQKILFKSIRLRV